jgi:hypothetical protein
LFSGRERLKDFQELLRERFNAPSDERGTGNKRIYTPEEGHYSATHTRRNRVTAWGDVFAGSSGEQEMRYTAI